MNPIPIILDNPRFHGSLLALIGKTVEEARAECPPGEHVNEEDRAQRMMWREMAKDEENGSSFPLYLMARVLDGRVWAVGIWAEAFFFGILRGDHGYHFQAVPRGRGFDVRDVNWIVQENDGYKNKGVSP